MIVGKLGGRLANLDDDFARQFVGMTHRAVRLAVTDLEPGAYDAFKDRVPCLIGDDRWVLVSVDRAAMTGVVVRKDSIAIVETFVRPAAP